MSVLAQVRKAVFGETLALPVGVALLLGAAAILKVVAGDFWEDAGGLVLLAGAIALLCVLVRGQRRPGAGPNSPGPAP